MCKPHEVQQGPAPALRQSQTQIQTKPEVIQPGKREGSGETLGYPVPKGGRQEIWGETLCQGVGIFTLT